eukprot:CAMPEP_0206443908 /NCGR_PEP_ID=MMETSP0324_2-20121206/14627_1 /ASSEMBLY_ACC=CAM_ASM_000836 /TAXON_ID=2866 /ORGANISM="Crypthecodinium cohnii, Strain Seligo" /LENGTH=803 /DNA_ID=CAMNT_0053911891 /DNA_START=45 /DNA_END=2456 /DNA_ORIENTATION=-
MGCNGSKDAAKGGDKGGAQSADKAKANKATDRKNAAVENKEYQAKMDFLAKVPLMKRLPKDQHPLVADAIVIVEFSKGQTVIKQGESGDEFFIIRQGEASVNIKGDGDAAAKNVAKLRPGDYFGENALLRDEVRMATIIAETNLSCFKLTRGKFQDLGLNDKLQFANRRAVGGGGAPTEQKAKPPSPKTDDEFKLIANAIRSNENLQTITTLDDARVQSFIDVMWKETVPAGTDIIKEGDLNADYFYVVQDGSFDIFVSEEEEGPGADNFQAKGDAKVVSTVPKGGSFGELALLYFVPRAATVKAKEQSVVWVIDRQNFKNILMKVSDGKIREYVRYLDGVSMLQALLQEEKKEVAKALVEMHFTKDELIIQQGEPGNTFYILYDGHVSIVKDGKEVTKLSASPQRSTAQYFGEGALLDNETRGATVQVTSETAKTLVLDRDAFNLLLGPLKDIIERSRQNANRPMAKGQKLPGGMEDKVRDKILRKDLSRIGLLGCGGFGTVELYEHKTTGDTYAMKGLSKGYIVKTGMQDSVMNEKNILLMTNSDFIIKLWETYNGSQTLYFLMEPALGGELYATYNRKGFHGSEKHAKYYIAGTVFAFEHLHERRIIYRDLKPENLLLTDKGHIKLTDMGLAKFVIGKTFTTCGTPDYFAPELIASTGHTNAVDWWMLGILTFELMSGHPPFESAYPMQIYSKVTKGISKVPFPPKCQGSVGDLIKQLLRNEPSERLPMRPGGVSNVKNHKWFDGFDWASMKALKLDPPYKPVVKSKKDLANFSARKEDMPKQLEYHDPGTGWDKDFATA